MKPLKNYLEPLAIDAKPSTPSLKSADTINITLKA